MYLSSELTVQSCLSHLVERDIAARSRKVGNVFSWSLDRNIGLWKSVCGPSCINWKHSSINSSKTDRSGSRAAAMDRLEGHVKLLRCSSKQVIIDHLRVQLGDFGHFGESSYMVGTAICTVDSFHCLRMRLVDICVFECCG